MHSLDEIYTAVNQGYIDPSSVRIGTVVWDYRLGLSGSGPDPLLTVSPDAIFVLKEILVTPGCTSICNAQDIRIAAGGVERFRIYSPNGSYRFEEGITFPAGSAITVELTDGGAHLGNIIYSIMIIGHEIPSGGTKDPQK